MRGIIILEGADGTGKTTLARELVRRHDAFYIHNGLWPNMWQRHLACVDLAIKRSQTQLVVIDRLWLSEQVYGTVFRDGPGFDLGARCLDRVLQRHGALTVLCVRKNMVQHLIDFDRLKKERPEKFTNIRRVAELYIQLELGNLVNPHHYLGQLTRLRADYQRTDFLTYDMDRFYNRPGDAMVQIEMQLEMCRSQALAGQFDIKRPNLAGNQNTARYLFVGEELSPAACSRAAPFLWGDAPSAATYLNAALRALNFDETLGLWTNAVSHDDWLPQLRAKLSATMRVIALGRIAAERCHQLGFPDLRHVPHPQWWRRFRHRDPDGYKRELKEALHV